MWSWVSLNLDAIICKIDKNGVFCHFWLILGVISPVRATLFKVGEHYWIRLEKLYMEHVWDLSSESQKMNFTF